MRMTNKKTIIRVNNYTISTDTGPAFNNPPLHEQDLIMAIRKIEEIDQKEHKSGTATTRRHKSNKQEQQEKHEENKSATSEKKLRRRYEDTDKPLITITKTEADEEVGKKHKTPNQYRRRHQPCSSCKKQNYGPCRHHQMLPKFSRTERAKQISRDKGREKRPQNDSSEDTESKELEVRGSSQEVQVVLGVLMYRKIG